MIHVINVKNPFDVREKTDIYVPCTGGSVSSYHIPAGGVYHYAINGNPVNPDAIPDDGDEIVIMPYVGKKVFSMILTIGLTIALGMITGGAGFAAGWSVGVRIGVGLAVSAIGGILTNKLTPVPKVDLSNTDTEQKNTYGWGGAQTLTGQGYSLPILYGKMKTAGIMLQRHVVSDGEKQYLNVLYALAEGPIDSISDIKLNGNPIENYTDVTVEKRYGTNNQAVISNFNDSYVDTPLAYELSVGSGWATQTLQGNTAEGLEVTIGFPSGLYYSNDAGGMDSSWVDLRVQYKLTSATTWTDMFQGRVTEKTNAAFYRIYRATGITAGQYDVRVCCVAKAGDSIRYANRVQWQSVTQIIYDDFQHPGKALLAIKALATDQLSGSDPQMTCVIERSNVLVWNPAQQVYVNKPATNPAWAAYDILHQCRDYDGNKIVFGAIKERMDYYAFAAWAQMCSNADATFNYLYDTATRVWDAVCYPARIGRGSVFMVGTRVTCVYDYAAEPVQLFSVANVKKESFKEEFLEMSSRANAIEISFLNKDKDYERDVLTVYNDDYDTQEAVSNPTQIELMGCVTAQQAYQYARWKLRENRYEIRTITFEAFVDAIACKIGDVVIVQTDVTLWGVGGRVEKVQGGVVYLDRPIDTDYTKIMVRDQSTDEINTASITAIDGNKVTVSSVSGMSADAVYVVGKTGNEPKKVKILAIDKSHSDETRVISAVEYYDELYDPDTSVVPVLPTYDSSVQPPKNLALTWEIFSSGNGNIRCTIHCTWLNPVIPNRIKLEISKNNGPWILLATLLSGTNTYSFDADRDTVYTVRVYAENSIGRRSTAAYAMLDTGDAYHPATAPTNIKVFTRFRELKDGVNRYDLVIQWKPDGLRAQIYYKTNHVQSREMVIVQGQKVSDIGYSTAWTYGGEGINELVIAQAIVGDTYKIAICTADNAGIYKRPDNATQVSYTVQPKSATPNTPDGFAITFTDRCIASWNEVSNADVEYYELRTNTAVGNNVGLLVRTNNLSIDLPLTSRAGRVYLYAKGLLHYSAPAILDYNKPAPPKPAAPTLTAILGGFSLKATAFPTGVSGMEIYINGYELSKVHCVNNTYTHTCEAGIYDVGIAWSDFFGEGEQSDEARVVVKVTVDQALLESGAVSMAKCEAAVQQALANGNYSKEQIVQLVAAMGDMEDGESYSALVQLVDALELRVQANKIISKINVSPETITIDGKLIHITGQTLFDSSVIVSRMLQAAAVTTDKLDTGAVTAAKLNVSTLSAICATIGLLRTATSGARLELESNQIRVYDANNTLRVRVGVWS